jgi:hypothetical protein
VFLFCTVFIQFLCSVFASNYRSGHFCHPCLYLYSLARLWFDLKFFVKMSDELFPVLCVHAYFELTERVV